MRQFIRHSALALTLAFSAAFSMPASAGSRLKDIVDIEGVRENQLIGYGLVVGLNGTGDSLRNSPFTRQSLEAMLERLGVNTRDQNLNTRNVAAVMVTANLPAFATNGSRIDVSVSSLGDAGSLSGGILLVTPLVGADGQVYAVGQGPVAAGGFAASGDSGTSVIRNVPTIGRIPNGALIEREVEFALAHQSSLRLALRNPDFTTSQRIAVAINAYMGMDLAVAEDSGTVRITRPPNRDMTSLITEIENLVVEPDQPARIVIDEASGVIVMGETVRVSTVAIAQGNLTIQISEQPAISQPAPFSDGETTVVPQSGVQVLEDGTGLAVLDGGVPLRDLVDGLNALGVTPRDMISILQALKASGALQADIEVM
ncbi:MAG: flagellar biosynthesis protein FlgA [Hyphomonadaceae bacterium TMED5]|nr:flagellar basal body P-ring protein FlgI [Ponticaulis sp.]MAI89013.1 flagellar biosynthesis protein FlgA [Ponticaulis sp.]OUY01695.1 MAG: flagellar biosynthesis protein FlgA [Hyphomonadaceae bacterium TMED5]|tara:strand:- start:24999 stop:26111 length:1113 start_codon:yes stop_codon:yes gene_type:complete